MEYDNVFAAGDPLIPTDALRVVGIASPDLKTPSPYMNKLLHRTQDQDFLMGTDGLVRKIHPGLLDVNTFWYGFGSFPNYAENSLGHSFVGYLKFSGGDILADVVAAVSALPLTSCGFTFSAPTYTGTAPGSAQITVTRKGGSATVESVTVSTSDGTAKAGIDYVPVSQQVTFQPGDSSKTVPITLLNNPSSTSGITVNLNLSQPSNGTSLGAQSSAVLTITKPNQNPSPGPGITSGIISTVAGNGGAGFSGDGGPATSASLNFPTSVALDVEGNLYIADYSNRRVRRLDALTGNITTVAGNGGSGGAIKAGVPATSTSVDAYSIALDAAGNLYVANIPDSRVRRVDALTGIITTMAGNGLGGSTGDNGPAISAGLSVQDIALDAAGNLYIAEPFRVRKVDALTGIITTVAGNGLGGFTGDNGLATSARLHANAVALDAAGNLYILDYNFNRVRKVDALTGIITTVAGNGGFSYRGDGGPATSAYLNTPLDIALDGAGNLYIADTTNGRVRRVDALTGIITTVAGGGAVLGDGGPATSAGVNPHGVALDAAGNLYIADYNNARVRKVSW